MTVDMRFSGEKFGSPADVSLARASSAACMTVASPKTARKAAGRGERGTILLLALIVLSSVVLASMGLGTLMVSSIQQSRTVDESIVAYYAAETAVEGSLYEIRRLDRLPVSTTAPQVMDSGAAWQRVIKTGSQIVYAGLIPKDSTYELALYDMETSASSNAAEVQVDWDGSGILAASITGWTPNHDWAPEDEASVAFRVQRISPSDGHSKALLSVVNPDALNRLRLRADGAALENVTISARDQNGAAVDLPGRIQITARGSYGRTEQRLQVSVPRRAPLAGLYDFVVFSECSLIKGGAADGCP